MASNARRSTHKNQTSCEHAQSPQPTPDDKAYNTSQSAFRTAHASSAPPSLPCPKSSSATQRHDPDNNPAPLPARHLPPSTATHHLPHDLSPPHSGKPEKPAALHPAMALPSTACPHTGPNHDAIPDLQ